MDWYAWLHAGEVILGGAVGGTTAVLGLSRWLGDVWLGRVLERERAKYAGEIEKLKAGFAQELERYRAQLDRSIFVTRVHFETEFEAYWASKRFCNEHSCPDLLDTMAVISSDWKEARTIVLKLSAEYLAGDNILKVQLRLEEESKRLVDQYWPVIEALAIALVAKAPEPMRPLKTGHAWSNQTDAVRYMDGKEAVEILAQHGIAAACKPRSDNA